jgi:hypothetical protein
MVYIIMPDGFSRIYEFRVVMPRISRDSDIQAVRRAEKLGGG